MSDVEDGTWLSFTWQGKGGMDEILVFALCMGYKKAYKFPASVAKGCSCESGYAGLPPLTILPVYSLKSGCVGHQKGIGKYQRKCENRAFLLLKMLELSEMQILL